MKATDLMIGDWVYLEHTEDGIAPYDEPTQWQRDDYDYTDVFVETHIKPIPLTPEILEKNGFYYDEDRKAYLMGVIFQVKPEKYGLFSFRICGCPYPLNTVHKLQHALRFCGIEKEITI